MNAKQLLPLLGAGALVYWLYSQRTKAATPPPATGITPSGANTWQIPALDLPAVKAWPLCPAGQYYDPNLNMCMVAPGSYSPPSQQCNMSDSSGCPPGWET